MVYKHNHNIDNKHREVKAEEKVNKYYLTT